MSPRRVTGMGLIDGEQLERLWSYLTRFIWITKGQTPSHRTDTLCLALLHLIRKKLARQGMLFIS